MEISAIMEMAGREAADMASTASSKESELNFMDKERKMIISCFCCGKKGHILKNYRFKDYACNACRKKSHLEIVYDKIFQLAERGWMD